MVEMARHVISVCIFCFICATHTPCASHGTMEHEQTRIGRAYHDSHNSPAVEDLRAGAPRTRIKVEDGARHHHHEDDLTAFHKDTRRKRHDKADNEPSDVFVRKIFSKFGDGDRLTVAEFERLVQKLNLSQVISDNWSDNGHTHEIEEVPVANGTNNATTKNNTCLDGPVLNKLALSAGDGTNSNVIGVDAFINTCPALLYSMLVPGCGDDYHDDHGHDHDRPAVSGFIWLYSILAVIVISACGLLALVVIPLMQKRFYKPLIQFLVALAVGTLAGDALLHLLPHAMSSGHEHGDHHTSSDDENMWKGFVAMMGLTFFFVMERVILLVGKWRKRKQRRMVHSHVRVVNETCMDKYNSIPYCFQDIMQDTKKYCDGDKTATTLVDMGSNSDGQSFKKSTSENAVCTESNKMLPGSGVSKRDDHQVVILREHESSHHGHSHAHGHVHAAPQNFSAVAWMVIMGDGLHNFTDGMAIGAAFSGSLAGGFSTTVAVFCHELPHELGDFAMLLKAGMTIKQAVFYNLLSSALCVLGNCFGVWLGNTASASSWVFAAAAGMFLYIALVDMIPELSSAHEDESNVTQCILHLSGLILGVAIMSLIAFYEHDLKHIFKDPN
ncbi:zinc transporter foi isoform X2 [Aethina tumida]|uniref:zinc transporter foi isoform X2 n=1 Tax=Aethina tumida TaxID=116153 RepID=UPI00096B3778|nr:zinc transporter foi isoform X2 [Aethina tumida]